MAIPNPIIALVDFLKADAGVAAEVGTKVFGAELPPGEVAAMPQKCLVLTASGGLADNSYLRVSRMRVDLKAYGPTPLTAWDNYLTAHEALKQMVQNKQGTALLHSATVSGGPIQLRDNDTDWPYIIAVYLIVAAEVAAV